MLTRRNEVEKVGTLGLSLQSTRKVPLMSVGVPGVRRPGLSKMSQELVTEAHLITNVLGDPWDNLLDTKSLNWGMIIEHIQEEALEHHELIIRGLSIIDQGTRERSSLKFVTRNFTKSL